MSAPDRRRLVDRNDGKLSLRRQCKLLGVARSGVYRLMVLMPRAAASPFPISSACAA